MTFYCWVFWLYDSRCVKPYHLTSFMELMGSSYITYSCLYSDSNVSYCESVLEFLLYFPFIMWCCPFCKGYQIYTWDKGRLKKVSFFSLKEHVFKIYTWYLYYLQISVMWGFTSPKTCNNLFIFGLSFDLHSFTVIVVIFSALQSFSPVIGWTRCTLMFSTNQIESRWADLATTSHPTQTNGARNICSTICSFRCL